MTNDEMTYDPDDENLDIILGNLNKLQSNAFFIAPDSPLCERGMSIYRKALMSVPARHRVKFAVRNLCTQLARVTVTLEQMQERLAADGIMIAGSQGQLVRHPLLPTITAYLAQVEKLTLQLAIGITEDRRTSAKEAQDDRQAGNAGQVAAKSGLLAMPPQPKPWEN